MAREQRRWDGPPFHPGEDGRGFTIEEILSYVPAEITARAAEAALLDPVGGHRQLSLVDDPYDWPLAHANPCTDAKGRPCYAIWLDGEPVGLASNWPDAHQTVELLCMYWRAVGPDDLLAVHAA